MAGINKSKSSKQNKNRSPGPYKRKIITLASVVVIVVILFIILNLYLDSLLQISSSGEAKQQMQQYLSGKYSEDFNISKPNYENGGFGVTGSWRSEAHPISNQKLKFDVGCTPSSDGTFGPLSCSDQYIAAIWSVQASKELEAIIKEVNTNSNGYKADSAQAEIILSGDLVNSVNKQYEDNKTKDRGFLYRLIIDAPNDSQKASYVFKIVERLRQEGVYSVDVDVNRNNNSKIRCEVFFNKNKLGSKDDIESCIVKTGE